MGGACVSHHDSSDDEDESQSVSDLKKSKNKKQQKGKKGKSTTQGDPVANASPRASDGSDNDVDFLEPLPQLPRLNSEEWLSNVSKDPVDVDMDEENNNKTNKRKGKGKNKGKNKGKGKGKNKKKGNYDGEDKDKDSDDNKNRSDSIHSIVPRSNKVKNLEDSVKYIKTLGTGATSRVVLATYQQKQKQIMIKRQEEKEKEKEEKEREEEKKDGEDIKKSGLNTRNQNRNRNGNENKLQVEKEKDKDENNKNKQELSINLNLESYEHERFALKQLRKDDKKNLNAFKREANILIKLRHENIVTLITCYIDNYNYYIATQYCYGGPLLDFIVKCKTFDEKQASWYLETIIKTVEFIHSKNIVHRDLKPGNIMFNKIPVPNTDGSPGFANDAKLIIIDFGEAIEIEDNDMYDEKPGTMLYMPPEITRCRKGWELKAGDMWSIGVIAYILLCGKPPFVGKSTKAILKAIGTQPLKWPDENEIPISRRCKQFIGHLCTKVPNRRATASQALNNSWILDREHNATFGNGTNGESGKGGEQSIERTGSGRNRQLLSNMEDFHNADKNGVVTKDEVYHYLRETGLSKKEAKKRSNEVMKMMDPSGKGEISLDAYLRAKTLATLKAQLGSDSELHLKTLEMLDPQNTGKIDAKLLEKQLSRSAGRRETVKIMKQVKNDVDSNGHVDIDTVHMVASASNSRETSDRRGNDHDHDYGDIQMDMEMKIDDRDETIANTISNSRKKRIEKKRNNSKSLSQNINNNSNNSKNLNKAKMNHKPKVRKTGKTNKQLQDISENTDYDEDEQDDTVDVEWDFDGILAEINQMTDTYTEIASDDLHCKRDVNAVSNQL